MSLMFLKLVFLKKNVFPQHKSCWLCRQLLTCHSIFSFSSFSMFLQSRISKSVVICFFCYFLCYFLLSIFSILLFFSTLLSIPCSVFSLCLFFFFFNWDSLHARLNNYYETWSYKKKKHKKIKIHRKSV